MSNYGIGKIEQPNLLNPLKPRLQNGSPKYHKMKKRIKREIWR
jgi:hypothetical protein